jgi:uncharacterized protein (DUF885 family)
VTSGRADTRASRELAGFFEAAFDERISRSPETLTALGIRRLQDRLDDRSEAGHAADCELIANQLERLSAIDPSPLGPGDRLDYELFRREAKQELQQGRYRLNEYLVNQKFGLHTDFPAFMINLHRIENPDDAASYVSRLEAFATAAEQVIDGLERREAAGVVLPAFLFPEVLADCRDFIGEPDGARSRPLEENVLFRDFEEKLAGLAGLDPDERARLRERARGALERAVLPGYRRMIAYLGRQQARAPEIAGAWTLPHGAEYYRVCLARHTTTRLDATAIHRLGLEEVDRIQRDMIALKDRLGFRGSLRELFAHARDHAEFYYPQTPDGRRRYLEDLRAMIDAMAVQLPMAFKRLPQDGLRVKPVEPHRERTAGVAFYEGPSADGRRPGTFYVNLHDMRQLPKFTMEALAYHEALPGHHLQFSIANRLEGLPRFRRYGEYTAYVEGWGLYSEVLAAELGGYADPYAEFGRLAQELKRACRLVADTGIHAFRWPRGRAVEYLQQHLPASLPQIVKEVERYIVMPGQATAYTVGMSRILQLREQAKSARGARFRLDEFHDEVLRHGPLPMDLLAQQTSRFAAS